MKPNSTNTAPKILVIDDDPSAQEDFRSILTGQPRSRFPASESHSLLEFELEFAQRGQEGYEMATKAISDGRPYSLVFCNMQMPPGWGGLTTIQHLWDADPTLQVVICTSYCESTWSDVVARFGQSDRLLILRKPFDGAEVLQIAVAMIEKRRLSEAEAARREELEELVADRTRHLIEARRESEQLLTAIDCLMIGVNSEGNITRWNNNAAKAFELSASEAKGKHITKLPVNWDSTDVPKSLIQCAGTREPVTRIKAKLYNADGSLRILGLSSYPIFNDQEFEGSLILGTDLTDNQALEMQLENSRKLESVGQLAAGVAHEINTPMQYLGDNLDYIKNKFDGLLGYLESTQGLLDIVEQQDVASELVATLRHQHQKLKLKKISNQIPEALTDSIEGVQHVSRIVRAMKELSHPGVESKSMVDVNRLLQTTTTVSTSEWKYAAELEMELEQNLDPVAGFSGELSQVFLNLIVNAAHAISDVTDGGNNGRGKIILRSRNQGEMVCVEISDTGGGIPAEIRDKVFDPFFTTKPVGKGTGQGLAIAHSVIVQKHGGRISVTVDEGVGSTFRIELPRQAQLESLEPADAAEVFGVQQQAEG